MWTEKVPADSVRDKPHKVQILYSPATKALKISGWRDPSPESRCWQLRKFACQFSTPGMCMAVHARLWSSSQASLVLLFRHMGRSRDRQNLRVLCWVATVWSEIRHVEVSLRGTKLGPRTVCKDRGSEDSWTAETERASGQPAGCPGEEKPWTEPSLRSIPDIPSNETTPAPISADLWSPPNHCKICTVCWTLAKRDWVDCFLRRWSSRYPFGMPQSEADWEPGLAPWWLPKVQWTGQKEKQ